ncbi:BZ3500_MvSof-1268-A1-R1_Chr3-1g06104 [Microbotryum saponariae]|uniref:histidine--tRNA ligase n=1 Tax=Microbotryum saponariae TaxID=289078 RepID=A0A2X0LT95_9BASI|nr:BZ3500_MvSof-1268-A1-R1_Chr3-1g06104 [Microbotryum saponariae]SDA03967.1 BZ3501_MvSof-1269-A2-R1_Chr3-2g05789 [Microbotryum saponariae]
MRLRLLHSLTRSRPLLRTIPSALPRAKLTMSAAPSSSSTPTTHSNELNDRIKAQGDVVRQLKRDKADVAQIEQELAKLKLLKDELVKINPNSPAAVEAAAKAAKGAAGKAKKFTLKTPKGTKDWQPADMILRQQIFKKITDVFELHGGVTIDTPVFELKEILSGKYGEDSKLIYDLQDQGGELCSLRYDLTVPFARFLAMNGAKFPQIKRYHIAKVYRRDQPAMSKGRMREFYQCDFDIAGANYDKMLPDAEILTIACQVLDALEIGEYTIKLNHRKILDGLFAVCGVPLDKTRTISSAVDKLDKSPWSEVKREMTEEKGLDPQVADKIGEYVKLKGGKELVDRLLADAHLPTNKSAKEGIEEMGLLFKYLDIFGVTDRMSFDLSLARGLDYYTGIIYEAVTEGSAPPPPSSTAALPSIDPSSAASAGPTPKPKAAATIGADGEPELDESTVGVGSIAAGGRYDELVGMFSGGGASGAIPCVGISFGVERLFSLLLAKGQESKRGKNTEVYVMSLGDGLLEERMKVCKDLWEAGIKAEFMYKKKPKRPAQFDYVDKERIPFAVIVAPDEMERGEIRIKPQLGKEEAQGLGVLVKRDELVSWLLKELRAGQ